MMGTDFVKLFSEFYKRNFALELTLCSGEQFLEHEIALWLNRYTVWPHQSSDWTRVFFPASVWSWSRQFSWRCARSSPNTHRAVPRRMSSQNRENRINRYSQAVTIKCGPWSKKANVFFLVYIRTFEPKTIQNNSAPATSPKYSFLSLGDFRDFDFIVTTAAGRRVRPVRTKNIFGNLKSSDLHLSKTFDQIGIEWFFAENGALE